MNKEKGLEQKEGVNEMITKHSLKIELNKEEIEELKQEIPILETNILSCERTLKTIDKAIEEYELLKRKIKKDE